MVARRSFLFDAVAGQYITRPIPGRTVEIRKCVVRGLLGSPTTYGATQLDDEAFEAPRRERRSGP